MEEAACALLWLLVCPSRRARRREWWEDRDFAADGASVPVAAVGISVKFKERGTADIQLDGEDCTPCACRTRREVDQPHNPHAARRTRFRCAAAAETKNVQATSPTPPAILGRPRSAASFSVAVFFWMSGGGPLHDQKATKPQKKIAADDQHK